jgi:phage terminase Nu1 subunit (DNA packaging protein)
MVADLCGITERRVDSLAKEGVLPMPAARGDYDVSACVKAYISHLRTDRRIYTGKELAELLGIAEPNLHKYREAGMPQVDRGRWDMPECVRWIIRRERDMRHKHGGGGLSEQSATQMAEEKLLAAREDRLLKEMLRKEKDKTLVRRSECEEGWAQLAGLIVAALEALPGRLSGQVAATSTVLEARRVLFDEARRIRAELARKLERMAVDIAQSSADAEPAGKPKKARRGAVVKT